MKNELEKIRGQSLSVERRRERAIEIAKELLNESRRLLTYGERLEQEQLAEMMKTPRGQDFVTDLTDQCFRSSSNLRVADQLLYLLQKYGIPRFLSWGKRMAFHAFQRLGKRVASFFVPLVKKRIRRETRSVILGADEVGPHLKKRREEGIRVNLNHLGEAVLGEKEAERRLQLYLEDLKRPEVDYVSVKLSSIFSQINLLSADRKVVKERLRALYRAPSQKFVNLDMEEYRDLAFTIEIFREVLDEPEFFSTSAGIVLQAYLPDSYLYQQEVTVWALKRVANGGAPIKIRLVKGANLAMEQMEARLKGWPQAPYPHKVDVDANYKRMVAYGCQPEHAKAAHLGIASHNLFDIAYALLLRSENGVEKEVGFEMLEGMASAIQRAVKKVAGGILLYCPVAEEKDFQNGVAYLVRRLDENTAPENFLRHLFDLVPGSSEWQEQVSLFSLACHTASTVSFKPRRTQNRLQEKPREDLREEFQNEPDTDFSLKHNVAWANEIRKEWSLVPYPPIPVVVGGKEQFPSSQNDISSKPLRDPSSPETFLCEVSQGSKKTADEAVEKAIWKKGDHYELLGKVAAKLREKRGRLIGAMMSSTGKIVSEADMEVSEAIDLVEYYRRLYRDFSKESRFQMEPKGVTLVLSPWNFPCAIACGGIAAALLTGNPVIFKPAPEGVLVGYELAKAFWEAGVNEEALQFLPCRDDPVGSALVKNPGVKNVILTGSTATAKLLMRLRPGLEIAAETGGKNAIIGTALADRDLLIRDVIQSAFSHAGQKCSACSLLILEKELYDDPAFLEHLADAAGSLAVGPPQKFSTKVGPLIGPPAPHLLRALTELEEGEEWLLKPQVDPDCPNLYSPGIKLGVKPGSTTHLTEFFGPLLGLMRAENLEEAIALANQVPYGLTSGLHTLDEREKESWKAKIEAGNCYINRGITGAIVRRQPFGGMKESAFGEGLKAGGPNYLFLFVHCKDLSSEEDYEQIYAQYFSKIHDPSHLLGQENTLRYVPREKILFRVEKNAPPEEVERVKRAAEVCHCPLEISEEPEEEFIARLKEFSHKRIRLLEEPSQGLLEALAREGFSILRGSPLKAGRVELLHYLREVSLSHDCHRYGNVRIETQAE